MFITVKYGDDKSEIFNPACKNCNLLQAIKFKCDLEKEDVVDLSDQTGTVKFLHKKPEEMASEFFEEREILILLRVEKQQEDDGVKYIPLLSDMKENIDFIAKLNPEKPKSDRHHRRNSQDVRSAKERKNTLQNPTNAAAKGRRQSRRFSKADFTGLPLTLKK